MVQCEKGCVPESKTKFTLHTERKKKNMKGHQRKKKKGNRAAPAFGY